MLRLATIITLRLPLHRQPPLMLPVRLYLLLASCDACNGEDATVSLATSPDVKSAGEAIRLTMVNGSCKDLSSLTASVQSRKSLLSNIINPVITIDGLPFPLQDLPLIRGCHSWLPPYLYLLPFSLYQTFLSQSAQEFFAIITVQQTRSAIHLIIPESL